MPSTLGLSLPQLGENGSKNLFRNLAGCCKTLRSPFDKLRANGACIKIVEEFPFVLSPSKHENSFFSSLLV